MIPGTPGETPRMTQRDDAAPVRRRDLRAERTGLVVRPAVSTPAVASTAAPSRPTRPGIKRTAVNMAVITVATGLIATMALPGTSLVTDPVANAENAIASGNAEAIAQLMATEAQSVDVAADVAVTAALRDDFGATTVEELAAARAAEERAARIAAAAAAPPAYSGPGVADFLANPPYPSFSLDQVVQVALQYQGTPYVFGGSSPAGFDCSGFVQFVYAQFGIGLPRTVQTQAAVGTRISREDALPGDVVIMPGHNGIYMGPGMILDAPRAGGVVSVRPIWTDNYYIVRYGI